MVDAGGIHLRRPKAACFCYHLPSESAALSPEASSVTTYAAARRTARKLLGPNAELRFLTGTNAQPLPLRYHIGVPVNGIFTVAGAGSNWSEALADVSTRLERLKREGVVNPIG